jgi:hypothetical protein
LKNRHLSIVGSNPTGGPLFLVPDIFDPLFDEPMEIVQTSALAEYCTLIHNEETWYGNLHFHPLESDMPLVVQCGELFRVEKK